jgi:hypothetical protein
MRAPSRRQWLLVALMPSAMMLGGATDQDNGAEVTSVAQAVVESRPREESTRAAVPEIAPLDLNALRRSGDLGEPRNAFEGKSWYVPPPPPPPPPPRVEEPPPAPKAPPLPFTYFGQYQESQKPVILLMQGERLLTVKEGEIIDGIYQVEGIQGRILTLIYLPLNIKQVLNVEPAG